MMFNSVTFYRTCLKILPIVNFVKDLSIISFKNGKKTELLCVSILHTKHICRLCILCSLQLGIKFQNGLPVEKLAVQCFCYDPDVYIWKNFQPKLNCQCLSVCFYLSVWSLVYQSLGLRPLGQQESYWDWFKIDTD